LQIYTTENWKIIDPSLFQRSQNPPAIHEVAGKPILNANHSKPRDNPDKRQKSSPNIAATRNEGPATESNYSRNLEDK
jgi:hypothetical protein